MLESHKEEEEEDMPRQQTKSFQQADSSQLSADESSTDIFVETNDYATFTTGRD